MWPRTKSDRTIPVIAMTIFLPTEEFRSVAGAAIRAVLLLSGFPAGSDGLQSVELLDGGGGLLDSVFLFRCELELDDAHDALGADHDPHAHKNAVEPVLDI